MRNFPQALKKVVERIRYTSIDAQTARTIINCADLSTRSSVQHTMDVSMLCHAARQGPLGNAASVTVQHAHITQAFNQLARSNVAVAATVNATSGVYSALETERITRSLLLRGVSEVEITLHHKALNEGNKAAAQALLQACRRACGKDARMKVVIETRQFNDHQALYDAATLAIDCGADMLVTANFVPRDRTPQTTLEAAATLLQAIRDNGGKTGLKIGGEHDNVRVIAPYMALARALMGSRWLTPSNFRIDGQEIIGEAARIANPPPAAAPRP